MGAPKFFKKTVSFNFTELRQLVNEAEGFNAKVGVLVTNAVGTMACAYLFCAVALFSLPATLIHAGVIPSSAVPHVLASEGLIGIVSWIAQTFIQLVLLSIIMVGQNVQSAQSAAQAKAQNEASDARAEKTLADTETIIDRLDTNTEGGIKEILDRIEEFAKQRENQENVPQTA